MQKSAIVTSVIADFHYPEHLCWKQIWRSCRQQLYTFLRHDIPIKPTDELVPSIPQTQVRIYILSEEQLSTGGQKGS